MFFDRIQAIVDVLTVQGQAHPSKPISTTTSLYLALVIFDGWLLFPSAAERDRRRPFADR